MIEATVRTIGISTEKKTWDASIQPGDAESWKV
jgi:hypothetical protein